MEKNRFSCGHHQFDEANCKATMDFQTHCDHYLRNIQDTQTNPQATPELSLLPHLHAFLETIAIEYFDRPNIAFTLEPRQIDQIGRPDIIALDGLLPIGYIEAEAYGRDLNRLTGHSREQNQRFIENLDNFILTNFVEFRLYTDGTLRATANLEDSPENLETLLERFLDAGQPQIASPELLARYLARRTRELQTQIATTLTDQELKNLIGNQEENLWIDFKQQDYHRDSTDPDKHQREICKDVTAMANAEGGYILIGVREENKIAQDFFLSIMLPALPKASMLFVCSILSHESLILK